jgi:hypothetical protein
MSFVATDASQIYSTGNTVRRVDVSPSKVDTKFDIRDKLVIYVEFMNILDKIPTISLQ